MATATARLKSRLKHGPRMGRELRAEFLLTHIGAAPRTLSPGVLAKLRSELQRLAQSTKPAVRRFVSAMRERYPQVRV